MSNSGYHDCPCRDCFEIAIGCDDEDRPNLCSECEEHGCSADGAECQAPHAYDQHCGDVVCCGMSDSENDDEIESEDSNV